MGKFSIFSTTADVGIKIQGKDEYDFFKHALLGINALLFSENGAKFSSHVKPNPIPIHLTGDSMENLLVKFLEEILYITYNQQHQVTDMQIKNLSNQSLTANLSITDPSQPPVLDIKSVTYHNLSIKRRGRMLSVEVIFDI